MKCFKTFGHFNCKPSQLQYFFFFFYILYYFHAWYVIIPWDWSFIIIFLIDLFVMCYRWQVFWRKWSVYVVFPFQQTSTQPWKRIIWPFVSHRQDVRRRLWTWPSTSGRDLISQRTEVIHVVVDNVVCMFHVACPNVFFFTDTLLVVVALKDLAATTRKLCTALWCALQITLPKPIIIQDHHIIKEDANKEKCPSSFERYSFRL